MATFAARPIAEAALLAVEVPAEVTALAAADPNPAREASAVPPAAMATKGIARREVAATVGPATARMGQVTDQGV